MPKINLNNANIYYETHGKGYPLVLITGFGCDHSFWRPLLDYLTPYFKVILFDNRGSGQTTHGNSEFTFSTLADDVMLLADSLGAIQPHILGHSMGGCIAQVIGNKYPTKINKLALFNSSAKLNIVTLNALSTLIELQKKELEPSLILDVFMPWSFSSEFLGDTKKVELHKKMVLEYPYPQTIEGNASQLNALSKFDSRPFLKSISPPTLIVGTDKDLLITEEETAFLNQSLINSELLILPGAHLSIIERPEGMGKVIREFFT